MPMEEQHIASAFDRDLKQIETQLMKMGGLVEIAIKESAEALRKRDLDLAEVVRNRDVAIDELDGQINLNCANVLALRQPAASDLRMVLAVMRISQNLERIGDYAKNIAKRTTPLTEHDRSDGTGTTIQKMASEVNSMLTDALDAFVRRDTVLAEQVRERDIDVDHLYNAVFRELLTFMMEDQRTITANMHLHFAAKNIERMGDHVTSIAEQVIYFLSGEFPEEKRPKASSL